MMRRALPLSFLLFAACETGTAPEQPKTPAPADEGAPTTTTTPEAPKATAADADCMGKVAEGTPAKHEWNGATWEENGSTISMSAGDAEQVVVGVVTDIKESSPENLANLKAFAAWFKKSKADMIIVDGDSGTTQEGIESAIGMLASEHIPTFVIIGNGEGRAAYKAAMAAIRQRSPHVYDLVQVRRVHTPQADFVSLPGYFNPEFIHAKDGCQYFPEDVASTAAIIKSATAPVVLVTHGGPKQSGAFGVDLTTEGNHVGDPELTTMLAANKVPFGIFGNIHEAGGHGTTADGNDDVPQKQMTDVLYLNPGPADSVSWIMNDKSESEGMAAIMTFSKGKASYEIMRHGGKPAPKTKGLAKAGAKAKLKRKGK